ncbi:5807_t:CDS:2 [Funneliformis caledonium]|uniref:5807_t:CDS:1 n=1 Tax=Funneliformis caledonium TaxID=1117310 RepID=A0A9N9AAT2_9GLOM|nr:5807_t:CDS:2 [Funneliformis caledonium]
MDMKSLEILIIHGLKMEDELLGLFRKERQTAKLRYEEKKKHELDTISNLAWKKLCDRYRLFEELDRESSEIPLSRENVIDISDKDLERIHSKYPGKEGQIDEVIKINSNNWNKLKSRYIFTSTNIFDILEMTEESASQIFYNTFRKSASHSLFDNSQSIISLSKYIKFVKLKNSSNVKSAQGLTNFNNPIDTKSLQELYHCKNLLDIKSIQDLKNIPNDRFIHNLINSSFLGEDKKELISVFLEEYKKWKVTISYEMKNILQKDSLIQKLSLQLKEEFEQEKQNIEFERICDEIMACESYNSARVFSLKYELEIIEPKATSLDQSESFRLHKEEFYIPNPIFRSYDENILIAVNEHKEPIAIYAKCFLGFIHILLQWYNNMVPNLQHLIFVKDTEELCFVEQGGRARIFNLVNKQFRPAVCSFPSNTANVLSSPDGSCIVAFIKEKFEYNADSVTEIKDDIMNFNNELQHNSVDANNNEISRAYV